MTGPLEHIQVVEFGRFVTAPFTARLLGDLGANIIKLETAEGDPFRKFSGDVELSSHFIALNRNKHSVVVDIRNKHDVEIIKKLIAQSDVFIENSRPGSMQKLGLDYDTLAELNPGLIYCSISGAGDSGPYANRPAYDMVGQAISGLADISIDPATHTVTGTNTSDSVTGMFAVMGILAAIEERHHTNKGQKVDINMLSSTLTFISAEAQIYLDSGTPPTAMTRPANSLSFAVRCSDEKLIGIHLSSIPKFWEGLTQVIDRLDIREDPRFSTRALRSKNYHALDEILQTEFARSSREEWLKALIEADIPCGPINTMAEVFEDPQIRHLGILQTMRHPELGEIKTVSSPFTLSGTDTLPLNPPPRLGEHTSKVLSQLEQLSNVDGH